jgi:Ethanolamine utilization protein EutJ (predicted chaperonin)
MQAAEATSATRARPERETSCVNATNDGITASGFTIVISVMKERRTTFDNGTGGFYVAGALAGQVSLRLSTTASVSRSMYQSREWQGRPVMAETASAYRRTWAWSFSTRAGSGVPLL